MEENGLYLIDNGYLLVLYIRKKVGVNIIQKLFDNFKYPFAAKYYDNTIVCYSFSKCMSIPGERVGYALVSPNAYESFKVINAIAGAERIIGHVCTPTLMQKAIAKIVGQTSDMKIYEKNNNKEEYNIQEQKHQ